MTVQIKTDAERAAFYANDEIWDHEFCGPDDDCCNGNEPVEGEPKITYDIDAT